MSITVRLWSDEDLAKIKSGKDRKLATVFMNASTFSAKEIAVYPYHRRKAYGVVLDTQEPDEEPIKVYATDAKTAKWFIDQEYIGDIVDMWEVITRTRPVSLQSKPKKAKSRKSSSQSGVHGVRR